MTTTTNTEKIDSSVGLRAAKDKVEVFSLRDLPLLKEGATSRRLLKARNLSVGSKVYSGGGENDLHSHLDQDHAFFVLSGSARFFDKDGESIDCGALEGIMIPRGVEYRFQSTGDGNLVILRVAGHSDKYSELRNTHIGADGKEHEGKDPLSGGSRGRAGLETGERFGVDGKFLPSKANS